MHPSKQPSLSLSTIQQLNPTCSSSRLHINNLKGKFHLNSEVPDSKILGLYVPDIFSGFFGNMIDQIYKI